MKKYIVLAIAVILILICVISLTPAPEPDHCAICDSIPFHAPALINLATGEVGELEIYEPHPFKVAELNEYQQGGTFSFLYVAGLHGYRDTANWETHITIPSDQNEYEDKYFCKTCRERLSQCKKQGYALVDLKDPRNPVIYEIHKDTNLTIRCYEITTGTTDTEGELELIILGTLYVKN